MLKWNLVSFCIFKWKNKQINKHKSHTHCAVGLQVPLHLLTSFPTLKNLIQLQSECRRRPCARGKLSRWSADNVLGFTALKWVFGAERQNTASRLPSDPNLRLLKFSFGCFFMSNGSCYLFSSTPFHPGSHLHRAGARVGEADWIRSQEGEGHRVPDQCRSEVDAFDQRAFQRDWEVV